MRKQQRDKRKSLAEGSDSGSPQVGTEVEAEDADVASGTQDSDSLSGVNEEEEDSANVETPEMTALKLELSTLMTSHGSMQSTLQLLQTQLQDLTRVNQELQVSLPSKFEILSIDPFPM